MSKKKNNKKVKKSENNYSGFIGYFKKLIEVQTTSQIILKFILTVIIIPILYWFVSDIYEKYQEGKLIEQNIKIIDKSFDSGEYESALKEYKSLIKSFNESEHSELYSDLLTKTGKTLLYSSNENKNNLKQSIQFLTEAENRLKKGTDNYNYNALTLANVYLELFLIENQFKFLNLSQKTIEKIKSQNQIIIGLKFFFSERVKLEFYNQNNDIQELEKALKFNEQVKLIFTNETNLEFNKTLLNDYGNIQMEMFHNTNELSYLENARLSYNKNYNSQDIDNDTYAMSMFGLGHYYKHKFDFDSISDVLRKGEELILKTLQIYDSVKQPVFYYSSKAMLAQLESKKFDENTDINDLYSSISNFNDCFNYYKKDFKHKSFYEIHLQIGLERYKLAKNNYDINILKVAQKNLEIAKKFYTYKQNASTHTIINSRLAHIYKILFEKEVYDRVMKEIIPRLESKEKGIIINADEFISDFYTDKMKSILIPNNNLFTNFSRQQRDFTNIANKYYKVNHEFGKLINENGYKNNGFMYKMLKDEEVPKIEIINFIKKINEKGVYTIINLEERGNNKSLGRSKNEKNIQLWKK